MEKRSVGEESTSSVGMDRVRQNDDHTQSIGVPVAMNSRERVAEIILEIQAALCNLEKPFMLTSGTASPVYVDCRRLIGFPRQRSEVMDSAAQKIRQEIGEGEVDVVAGGETAGIPFAAFVADRLELPMIYVRKKPKGFGRQSQIEGYLEEGRRVVLVEDLVFDGGSKLLFCDGIRRAGGLVSHTLAIFEYGFRHKADESLAQAGIKLHTLCDWPTLLEVARAKGYFTDRQAEETYRFLDDPKAWSHEHGGV